VTSAVSFALYDTMAAAQHDRPPPPPDLSVAEWDAVESGRSCHVPGLISIDRADRTTDGPLKVTVVHDDGSRSRQWADAVVRLGSGRHYLCIALKARSL
jgi:hypothetical protein